MVDELIEVQKTFAEEMIGAGGEWGNRLTLFATGLVACSGSACGGERGKRNAGGINGKCCGVGFRTGGGGLVHLCVLVAD